jgi:VWFA-related protein
VQVNVIVHKKGEPVGDLKKEDFTLFDRGKEQKIAVFSVDSIDAPPTPLPVVPGNLFSNRFARTGTPSSVTVILFDGLNTKIQDQAYAKQQVIKFLGQIRPNDRVAVYVLGRQVRILHDFTNDPQHLVKTLAKYRGRISTEADAADPTPAEPTGNDDLDEFLQHADQVTSDFYNVNRARLTLDAMEAIAHHLSAVPGRKNLVWVSSGFPFTLGLDDASLNDPSREHRAFYEETARAARAMNDASVAIYPVDARGLIGSPLADVSRRSTPIGRPGATVIPVHPNLANQDTMVILADRTGGRAFYNTNDLDHAIRTAVDDARVTYTLGFYATNDDWDGKFHDLKVKVNRGGLDVRYRKGFIAFTQKAPTAQEIKDKLQRAVSGPLEAAEIAVNARVDPSDTPKPGSLLLIVQISPSDVSFEQQKDRWRGSLEIVYAQRAPDGKILDATTDTLEMNLTQARYEDVQKRGLLLRKPIQPVDTADQLRIVVLDRPTTNVGSLHIPIKR